MDRFAGQIVVITGGGSGIGRATAQRIAREGGKVVVLDVDEGGAAETVELVTAAGGSALAIRCDVASGNDVRASMAQALDWSGAIDSLVNCAGTGCYRHFAETDTSELDRIMAVNFGGTFATCRQALDALTASRGSIVNIASAAAVRGSAYLTAYSASKGAVVAFTKSLAVELGPVGVRVNCICPGGTDTPLLRLFRPPTDARPELLGRSAGVTGRMSHPDEIAASVAFLASSDASNVTGAVVVADGGSVA